MTKKESVDNLKNKISMALKDPVLQIGFEVICKQVADLEKENAELKDEYRYWLDIKDNKLTKAKDIIKALLKHTHGQNLNTQNDFDLYLGRIKQAEQFLKESE